MPDEIKPCPFCGGDAKWEKKFLTGGIVRCSNYQCIGAFTHLSRSASSREWNTRPAEDALKAEVEELRYIVEEFSQWYSDDGCPKKQNQKFPCSAETEYKNDPETDGDFNERECWKEAHEAGCWVEYYRWKFRQEIKSASAEKGGEDE